MGILKDLFGGKPDDDGDGSTYASTRNSAEAQASADYLSEALNTGKDPIPESAPSWASNIPSPSDYKESTDQSSDKEK